MAARPPSGRRGATILEILIAISILVTTLAIGIPSLVTLRGPYVLRSATDQITADLDVARQRAIARNARYRLTFTGSTYLVERETAPNSFVQDGGVRHLPTGAAVGSATPSDPIFNTRGMLAADVSVPVTVSGTGTRTVTINVLGRTTTS